MPPSVPVSCETTADEDIIDRAAFGASPISPLPEGVFEIVRTSRVILGEAKYGKIVPEIDGCLPVAALTAFIDVKFGLNMGL